MKQRKRLENWRDHMTNLVITTEELYDWIVEELYDRDDIDDRIDDLKIIKQCGERMIEYLETAIEELKTAA
jgi:hypothetical protein